MESPVASKSCSPDISPHAVDPIGQQFLIFLPLIERLARQAFGHLPLEARDDQVQNVVGLAFAAYRRLIERGRGDRAFATPLALSAIRHARAGGRFGNPRSRGDVLDDRHRQRVRVVSLDDQRTVSGSWQTELAVDRRPTPAEAVACRLDVDRWLQKLPRRRHQFAVALGTGATTQSVAQKLGVSPGRVSQMRRELAEAWRRDQDDDATT